MDFLKSLQNEQDYDSMCKKLVEYGNSGIDEIFPEFNTKVLLSSFMLINFKEVYQLGDEIVESSNIICTSMLNLDFKSLTDEYKNFHDLFTDWRKHDITLLKVSIEDQKTALAETATSPKDEADEMWNTCVSNSLDKMDTHIITLDEYSKTPPKY